MPQEITEYATGTGIGALLLQYAAFCVTSLLVVFYPLVWAAGRRVVVFSHVRIIAEMMALGALYLGGYHVVLWFPPSGAWANCEVVLVLFLYCVVGRILVWQIDKGRSLKDLDRSEVTFFSRGWPMIGRSAEFTFIMFVILIRR